jgi:hypothetical protein
MADEELAENAETTDIAESPRLVRRGWNPPIGGAWGWITARRIRRLLVTVAGVALLAWFAWLVWAPFQHPRVQLVCLSGGDYQALQAPPLAFTAEDIAGLASLDNLFDERLGRAEPYIWDSLAEPAKLQLLGAKLRGITESTDDTVILVVSAHGQLEDGEPYVVCRNFDLANPKAGRLSMREFLAQVRACRAGRKVVILDIARIEDDPRLGFVWNDFSKRVAEAVRESGDDTLWLLTVNSAGERSQTSPGIDRSVFGYALERGLAGAADANADQVISLDELHRFTAATVSDWVGYVSDGDDQQHPLLAWGGEPELAADAPAAVAEAARPSTTDTVSDAKKEKPGEERPVAEESIALPPEQLWSIAAEVILAPVSGSYDPEEIPSLEDQVKLARKTSRGEAWRLALDATPTAARGASAAARANPATEESPAARDVLTNSLSRIRIGEVRSAGELRAQAESSARQTGEEITDTAIEGASDAATKKEAASEAPADAPASDATSAATADAPAVESTSTGEPASGSANAAAAPAAGDPAAAQAKAKAAARVEVPKLFAEAWRLRDSIAALPPPARPRSYAAQCWRELQQLLLDYELQYRAGKIGNLTRIKAGLERIIAGEKLLLESATNPNLAAPESGPAKLLRFRPWAAQRMEFGHSAAMDALIARRSARPLSPAAKSVLDAKPSLVEDAATYRAHWNALPPAAAGYTEARAARMLGTIPEQQWSVAMQAWRATLAAETLAAADSWIVPWAQVELDAADALRWEAERELFEAIGADHATKAAQLLDQAMTRYQTAAEILDAVARARELRDDLLERAPDYLRLQSVQQLALADTYADFCEQLGTLCDLLTTPDAARIAELRDATEKLEALRISLEAPLNSANVNELTNVPAQPGDPRRVAALLSTPLPAAEARLKLLSIVARLDGRLIGDLKPLPADAYQAPIVDDEALAAAIVVRARWHNALVQLVGLNQVDSNDVERKVAEAFYRLQDASAAISLTYRQETVPPFYAQLTEFETLLGEYYAALPRRIADAAQAKQDLSELSTRAERVIALRRIERALRLVDGRDARRTGDVPVSALIDVADWHELLSWHAERAARGANESSGEMAAFWSETATSYRAQAASLLETGAATPSAQPALVLEGPETLDLTVEPDQEAAFTLTHRGDAPTDVWLTLRFDPEIVGVEGSGSVTWYQDQDFGAGSAIERDEALFARGASLRMNPGQQVTLRLRAQSRARATQPARVVVRAVTRESTARRTLAVSLPTTDTIDLAIDGVPGTWSRQGTRWLLNPLPNRENRYRWSLVNAFGPEKEAKAELFALSRPLSARPPAGSLSAAEATEFLDRVGSLRLLAAAEKIALPSGGMATPIPFPPPPADAPPPAEGAPPPELPRFDDGALLLVTELASGRVSVHPIGVAPQRPRRFVSPRVRYNAIEERIEITVTADDPAAMPETPVRVACQVVEPLPPGTQARLSDELRAPNYMASLWIDAPLDPARLLTLTLSVDDYPRAFTFRVPCQETGRDIAPEADFMAARVSAPTTDASFRAPAGAIDVRAEIDLPRAAEDDPRTLIEVGFDTDRDRDFRGEGTVRLPGDRQVRNELVQTAPGGVVVMRPKVSDFDLSLTPPGLVNNRVGVLARITWGDRTAWSEPREIILDGTAPRIERVRVKPAGVVAIGEPIEVSCLALDGDLSGVASVEMTIDQLGTGEFEGNLPPMPGKLGADRRWTSKLDTAPLGAGTFHVLVRAKDQVGNESEINSSATVRLMTPEALADERRRATNRVIGTLLYGNSGFPGIQVRLEALPPEAADAAALAAAPPEPIAPVATNDQGAFSFDRVPPGKYKLIAEGVVRNKTRRAETEVTVDPAPTAIRPLQLELR